MGLKNITVPEAKVEFPGGSFAVRGLSLDDIVFLVNQHGAQLKALFDAFTSGKLEADGESAASFAIPLLQMAPEVAAQLIACASGDREDAAIAATLPFPVQIDALEKVADLTFNAAGGPKKLVETVIRVMQGTTGLLDSLNTPKA